MDSPVTPCPFCRDTELEIGRSTEDREGLPTYIFCTKCGAQGPRKYLHRDKYLETTVAFIAHITGWNKRA